MPCDNIVSVQSPVKSIGCSAKKRWLRAAMSEDHSESLVNGGDGGGGHGADGGVEDKVAMGGGGGAALVVEGGSSPSNHYTPLKKRRLQSYKESGEVRRERSGIFLGLC